MDDTPRSGQRRHHRHPTSRRLPSPHPASCAQVSPALPSACPSPCLPQTQPTTPTRSRGRHDDTRHPDTRHPIVRCVVVVVDHQRQPINRSIESNQSNRINRSTNRSTDRPRQPTGPPPATGTPSPPRARRRHKISNPANRSDREIDGRKISSSKPTPTPGGGGARPSLVHLKMLWAPLYAVRNDPD